MSRFLGTLLRRPAAPPRPAAPEPRVPGAASKLRYLSETDIFRDLGPAEMEELARMAAMSTCRRGRVFYEPSATGEVLFILKRGRVNLYRLTADGRKLVTATIEPGTVFGEMALIGQGMRGSFAEAAEDCTLCVMSRADLEHVLSVYPQVALRLIEALAARLEQAEERLETVAFKSAAARLAATLLQLADARGELTGISHQELAEQVGAFRETTTRILNDFRAQGLIDIHHLRICILNPEGPRALTEN